MKSHKGGGLAPDPVPCAGEDSSARCLGSCLRFGTHNDWPNPCASDFRAIKVGHPWYSTGTSQNQRNGKSLTKYMVTGNDLTFWARNAIYKSRILGMHT